MPFVRVPNTARVALLQRLHGEDVVNVLHFESGSAPTATSIGNLCAGIATWWEADLAPHLSGDISLSAVEGRSLDAEAAPFGSAAPSPTPTGDVAGGALPGNVAFCIKHQTGLTGRSARGRTYVAGLAEDDVTANSLSTTRVNGIEAAFNSLRTVATTSGFVFVVVSLFSGGAPRTLGQTISVLSSYATDNVVDSQRRRLSGRGS